jgi:hypothetical protein
MSAIVVNPTSTAQWHALVSEAEAACDCRLDEELESYLVFLLMRFVGRPDMASAVLAMEYLNGLVAAGRVRVDQLRDVGDKCLLFSGLFPKRAERRRVKVSYYVGLGRSAYQQLADNAAAAVLAQFYGHLAEAFVRMMDVLQATRALGGEHGLLAPLEAFELWAETGSQRAFRTLREGSGALPIVGDDKQKH